MIITFFFIFGVMIGSFMNAVIYRIPRSINIAFPRSHCTSCKRVIPWYENIPVLSYIFLRGRCYGCKTSFSIGYPLIEILIGLVSVLLAPKELSLSHLMYYGFYFSIFCALFCHFVIDLKHQILPDSINLYIGALFLTFSILNKTPEFYLIGLLIGFAFPYIVTFAFYKIKGQVGLGGGDIKLFAVLGIFLGPIGIINNIFLSCFIGAVYSLIMMSLKRMHKNTKLAFGPFIILVAVCQIYFPQQFKIISSLWSV